MARFKRGLKIFGKVALALVLVALVVNGSLRFYWGRQIESKIAALKAAGEPVSFADLRGAPVPDSENAAPIYAKAFKVMAEPAMRKDIDTLCQITSAEAGRPSRKDWDNAKAAAKRCDKVFKLIEEAQSKPVCQYPLPPANSDVNGMVGVSFTKFARLRDTTRFLCGKAFLNAHEGDVQGMIEGIDSALKLKGALDKQTSLIGYLVYNAIAKITLANLYKAMGQCSLNEAQLRQLDSVISQINSAELCRSALTGERVYYLQIDSAMKRAGLGLISFQYGETSAYLDNMAKLIDGVSMDYSAALSKGLVGDKVQANIPVYATISGMLIPVFAKANVEHYKTDAEIACCRVSLGLEAYKVKFRRYPQNLSQLKSQLKWALPIDPFSGKALIYKPNGKSFTLYSIGPDQKDDGGRKSRKYNRLGVLTGDIIWKWDR
ncbi:MAG: hypothetical protein NT018_10515 [Armatimonadetes bacterium]|nr:hypothetical protein [Armatimonadota bacterium]